MLRVGPPKFGLLGRRRTASGKRKGGGPIGPQPGGGGVGIGPRNDKEAKQHRPGQYGGGGGASLPAGMANHYDLSDPATLTLVGSAISSLADKSGNERTLTVGFAAKRPLTTTMNGLGASSWDGTKILLGATAGMANEDQPFTFAAAVASSDTSPAANEFFLALNSGSFPFYGFGISSTPAWLGRKRDTSSTAANVEAGAPDTSPHVLVFVHSGTAMTIYLDGVAIVTGGASDVGSMTGARDFNMGAFTNNGGTTVSNGWVGAIGEQVLYTSALSGADLTNLINYMGAKWLP